MKSYLRGTLTFVQKLKGSQRSRTQNGGSTTRVIRRPYRLDDTGAEQGLKTRTPTKSQATPRRHCRPRTEEDAAYEGAADEDADEAEDS